MMVDILNPPDIQLKFISVNGQINNKEDEIYFYRHSDHLGSAGWITDANGYAIQYMHYLPYGQLLANQMTGLYDERYKFTGKERDAETGYDYFGARFYSSQLLHWTSVDQLTDSYPWISPYAYCGWNPIKFVDPDGRDIWELDENGSVVNQITDKTQDAFRINRKQISFKYGSVTDSFQDKNQTSFTFDNEDLAANAFKFMADNSIVEYGLVNGSQTSTIVTQHNEDNVDIGGIITSITSSKEVIKSFIHNHPQNSGPSGFGEKSGDRQALKKYESKLGYNIEAYVYQPRFSSLWLFTPSTKNNMGFDWGYIYPVVGNQSTVSPSIIYRIKFF